MKKIITLLLVILLYSCAERAKITKNDLVVKCVIEKVTIKEQVSVLDIEPVYEYHTNCGEKVITKRNDVYKVGDTVTYVYVNYYNNK